MSDVERTMLEGRILEQAARMGMDPDAWLKLCRLAEDEPMASAVVDVIRAQDARDPESVTRILSIVLESTVAAYIDLVDRAVAMAHAGIPAPLVVMKPPSPRKPGAEVKIDEETAEGYVGK